MASYLITKLAPDMVARTVGRNVIRSDKQERNQWKGEVRHCPY